jgi:hypothetical protein
MNFNLSHLASILLLTSGSLGVQALHQSGSSVNFGGNLANEIFNLFVTLDNSEL